MSEFFSGSSNNWFIWFIL